MHDPRTDTTTGSSYATDDGMGMTCESATTHFVVPSRCSCSTSHGSRRLTQWLLLQPRLPRLLAHQRIA
eukprot:4261315-Prymnesium_polylepis.1